MLAKVYARDCFHDDSLCKEFEDTEGQIHPDHAKKLENPELHKSRQEFWRLMKSHEVPWII